MAYAKRKCKHCLGRGILSIYVPEQQERNARVCECAFRRFFDAHRGDVVHEKNSGAWYWKPGSGAVTHYCLGFAFTPSRRVVLVEKNRPAWQVGKLNGVGGHVESGETADEAMAREFFEETGVAVLRDSWRHFATLHNNHAFRLDCFYTRLTAEQEANVRTTTDEPIILELVSRLYVLRAVPNLRWLIPMAESFEKGERAHHFEIEEVP